MKRRSTGAGKGAAVIFLLVLLGSAYGSLLKVEEMKRLGVYELETPVDRKSAENILQQEALAGEGETVVGKEESISGKGLTGKGETVEYSHDILFFSEEKKQDVENPEWYRKTRITAVEILGDSVLLFPFAYPLEPEDLKGCLLGEETARELFGEVEIIGEEIVYKGESYEIRGILPKKNLLVIEGGKESCFSYAGILGDSPAQRDGGAEELQNLGGIFLTEVPLRFYGTILRMEITAIAACLYGLAGFLICQSLGKKKSVKKGVLLGAVLLGASGLVFILSITPYRMPDKVSDISWWENFFTKESEAWDSFFGREELFIQEEYKSCILPGKR